MPYQSTTYNVMIASPSDVPAERASARQTVIDWNVIHSEKRRTVLLPIGWETHSSPQMGQHPQKILNKQILERSDLLVAIFWARLGTPTPDHPSGTVEEIEEHIATGKPAMLYFSRQPVERKSVDATQYDQLLEFKASCRDRGLLEEYDDVSDFREKFARQLQLKINDDPYFSRLQPISEPYYTIETLTQDEEKQLTDEAKLLLKASTEGDGIIMRLAYMGGTDVQAGGHNFVESSDRREIARWEEAVNELESRRLIEDKKGLGEVFFVTSEGFRISDTLPPFRSD